MVDLNITQICWSTAKRSDLNRIKQMTAEFYKINNEHRRFTLLTCCISATTAASWVQQALQSLVRIINPILRHNLKFRQNQRVVKTLFMQRSKYPKKESGHNKMTCHANHFKGHSWELFFFFFRHAPSPPPQTIIRFIFSTHAGSHRHGPSEV